MTYTTFYWQTECNYCCRVADKGGLVPEMNNDKATFNRYVSMQQKAAESSGFHDAATYLQEVLDDLASEG